MEHSLGHDLSGVRVHQGATARDLNHRVQSKAFTTGKDIYFRDGLPDVQSTEGRYLWAHELTHTTQQPGRQTVHRLRDPLTTKQILAALSTNAFLKGKLAGSIHNSSMADRVAEMMRLWKQHCAKKTGSDVDLRDAMMLSIALDGVARVLSEELNDPSAQPAVAQKLFELYRAAVGRAVQKKRRRFRGDDQVKVLDLTESLISDDPVTRYMHREIGVDAAARQIHAMSVDAQRTDPSIRPSRMFELMKQRFEVKMASYHRSHLRASRNPETDELLTTRFDTRESPGEYSDFFFEKMFGAQPLGDRDALRWTAGAGAGAADELVYADEARQRLADLSHAVTNPTAVVPPVPRAGLSPRQEAHLGSIEQAESDPARTAAIRSDFEELFQHRYFMSAADSARLYTDVASHVLRSPITITVRAADWFGDDSGPDSAYKPANAARARTPVADVFGVAAAGDIEHLPTWDDTGLDPMSARGREYLRFRAWKDELLTGLRELDAAEKAVFGALNVTFDVNKGGDAHRLHGQNYYGDVHFVLDQAHVGPRTVYTATDHGEPRRDPMGALHDLTFGGVGLTWLKSVRNLDVIDHVVNATRTRAPIYGLPLLLEAQIFGGVDIKTDVTDVHVAKSVDAALLARIQQYYSPTPVNVSVESDAPAGAVDGISPFAVAELLAENTLDTAANASIDRQAAQATLDFQKSMTTLLRLGEYLRKVAVDQQATLTPEESNTLRAGLAELRTRSRVLNEQVLLSGSRLDEPSKRAIEQVLAAAERALRQLPS